MKLSELLENPKLMNHYRSELIPTKFEDLPKSLQEKVKSFDEVEEQGGFYEKFKEFKERERLNNWKGFKWRHMASLAQSFFETNHGNEPEWAEFRDYLLRDLVRTDKVSFIKACLRGYLKNFDSKTKLTLRLANSLQSINKDKLGSYSRFAKKFNIFEPKNLEKRIAENINRYNHPINALKDFGISTPDQPGLFEKVFDEFLILIKDELKNPESEAFQKLQNWLKPNPDNKKTTEIGRTKGIEAMIEPFINNPPSEDIKKEICGFLVENFKDPRVGSEIWIPVRKEIKNVVIKWLTGVSIKVFFDIISRFEESHMWDDRKKFWTAILKEGLIEDAWPILNPDASKHSLNEANLNNDFSLKNHGIVKGRYTGETCYLIMEIGDCRIVEGSHDFAIKYFKINNDKKPTLGKKSYSKSEFGTTKPSVSYDKRVKHLPGWEYEARKAIQKYR